MIAVAARRPRRRRWAGTKGRPEDTGRNGDIAAMLAANQSWSMIQRATDCTRATIAKIAKCQLVAA